MIDSLVLFLICLIVISVFRQPKGRILVAAVFALTIYFHDLYFHTISDNAQAYYISNGLLSVGVLWFITRLNEHTQLARDLQIIALVSIMFDLVGYFIPEPTPYMLMYIFLYGWAIFTLNRGEPYGDIKGDTRLLSFRPNVHFRLISHHN